MQESLAINRYMYCVFVNLENAFDSIAKKELWDVLAEDGVKARLLNEDRTTGL